MAPSYERTEELFARSKAGYRLVNADEAKALLATVNEFALDFETTALDPNDGYIRITSICCEDFHFIIDHNISGPFLNLLPSLRGKRVWVYNAKFETRWIDWHCESWDYAELIDICDVDFLAKAKLGGHPSSLAKMAGRDLGIIVDKDEQNSNWGAKTLSQAQMDYAAFDSYITWELYKKWDEELNDEQFDAALFVFNSSVRGTIEAERTGLHLDSLYHEKTVQRWEIKRKTFERYLRKYVKEKDIPNLQSDVQIGKYFQKILDEAALTSWPKTAKTKRLQFEGSYIRSISRQFPYPFSRWLAALAGYKYYGKYLSTYGDTLLTSAALAGKVHSRFNIGQAATGRYSSSSHNLQNIPRKVYVRKAFYSPDLGELLMCLADYKGIEIRVLAEISDDQQLRYDAIYSDVHSASASAIFGHDLEWFMEVIESKGEGKYSNVFGMCKEQRSRAKGFTFQLLYGAGPAALSDVLRCTFDEALEAINAWAARYPNAYDYRNKQYDAMNASNGFLPVWDGRTVLVPREDRSIPVAANYGVQGAAASVMYRAMYRCHRRFHEADLPAWIAATVHDEMLSYSETEYAEETMDEQIKGMVEAWTDIFPGTNTDNLVDYAIGATWAAKP
jgi:DNA polymerase I-like protein with 3'-5' exonuclease and polymerase domains